MTNALSVTHALAIDIRDLNTGRLLGIALAVPSLLASRYIT